MNVRPMAARFLAQLLQPDARKIRRLISLEF
jgi:hypothetical protein